MSDRMREVELVEGADESSSLRPAPDTSDDPGSAARSWLRRNARWLVPTAVVAILTLVGTQVVVDARERSRLEALAAIPGIVPPTGPGIGVIWRADPKLATVLQGGASVDGLLVGGRTSGPGEVDVVALDVDTGAVRWTHPVHLPAAEVTPGGSQPTSFVGCTPVHHGGRALVACVSQQYGENIVGTPDSGLWVVDPTNGSVLTHEEVPGDSGVAFTDGALVIAGRIAPDDGVPATPDAPAVRWRATATDLITGAPLWTYTTPVVDDLGRDDGSKDPVAPTLQTFGDRMVLSVDAHAWVLGDDGTLERDVALDPGWWVEGTRGDAFIESSYSSADVYAARLLLPDGTSAPIDETTGWLAVDDGSAPGVIFTVGAQGTGAVGLSGREATTGTRLWHRDEPVTQGLLLDGVLYIATDKAIEAIDATTGRTRWSTKVDFQPQQLFTDGRYLLVPGLGVSLRAYQLSNGHLGWTKDLKKEAAGDRDPVYVQGFQPGIADPRLYVWMDDGAVAVLG